MRKLWKGWKFTERISQNFRTPLGKLQTGKTHRAHFKLFLEVLLEVLSAPGPFFSFPVKIPLQRLLFSKWSIRFQKCNTSIKNYLVAGENNKFSNCICFFSAILLLYISAPWKFERITWHNMAWWTSPHSSLGPLCYKSTPQY